MGLPELNRANILKLQGDVGELKIKVGALVGEIEGFDPIISDESFPNIIPPTPIGVTASALFRTIQVTWVYDSSSYISSYEVHASKEKGFRPTDATRVYVGRDSGYQFPASLDETWHFKVRARNYHDEYSEFSEEASATTVGISEHEIDEKWRIDLIEEVNQYTDERKQEIMDEVANKLDADVYHDNIILKADKVTTLEELAKKLEKQDVQDVVNEAIDELVITQEKIAPGAVGTNQIESGSIREQQMKWSTHLIF